MFSGAEQLMHFFCRVLYGEHSCKIILNLVKWFRRRCRLKKTFTDNRLTPDGPITIAHIKPSAQVSKIWGVEF